MDWKPSDDYARISQANKVYYQQTDRQYETTETCLTDPHVQARLQDDLKRIVDLLSASGRREIRALDACGGSGNVSLKLGRMPGVNVTLCDQSAELIAIFRQKCNDAGMACHVADAEIAAYLSSSSVKFDLIVFSSALHHLEDYASVLKLATERLNEGGFIFTVFDPVAWKFPAYQIVRAEYIFFKLLNHRDAFAAVQRKLRKFFSSVTGKAEVPLEKDINWGAMAEYHVEQGIDDLALVRVLQEQGLEVVWHVRETTCRYSFFRFFLKLFGCVTGFKLLLQKQSVRC